jgi:DNA primase
MGDHNMTQWVDFKTVREHLKFQDVLSHYGIAPHGAGDQIKVICPFHDDNKPSCGVNIVKHVYNCFACDAGGNALDFIAHMEGLDPSKTTDLRKAAFIAAETFGIDQALERPANGRAKAKTDRSAEPVKAKTKKTGQSKPPQKAEKDKPVKPSNQPLTFELKLDHKHPFIKARQEQIGFKKKLVKQFGVGFANKGMMKDRICFPIHNDQGELIAYSGRWASDDLPEDVPRYLLPKGFEKSKVLYNLHRVLEQGSETVVIVEGFWSVMRLHDAGIPCVSTFGDSLSEAQAYLLFEHGFEKVILIYDGDEGGRIGTASSLPILSEGLFVKMVMLEEGIKPDTMGDDIMDRLPRYHGKT